MWLFIKSFVENNRRIPILSGENRCPPPALLRRIARAKWFSFLRRVYRYQNDPTSQLESNPFNSTAWIASELLGLLLQITIISASLYWDDHPFWPITTWMLAYDLACLFTLPLVAWRYYHRRSIIQESRSSHIMNTWRTCVDLFTGIWFVMGIVWLFGSPTLKRSNYYLCVCLLVWNGINYSFPFVLFILFCCCVPLINCTLGYNMTMASIDKGATDDQISSLPRWTWSCKEIAQNSSTGNSNNSPHSDKCSICLTKYKDSEEVRQLPCYHVFHQGCVDQWLRIMSYCPLCKQECEQI